MRINESNRYIPVRQQEPSGAYRSERDTVASGAAADTGPAAPQDVVTISAENTQWTKEEALSDRRQSAAEEMDEMNRLMKSAKAQAAAETESAEVRRKCMIIAGRIMAGDEVPREDHRYLAKHDLGLYCRAICMRVVRENAKRHKRISDDEDTKSRPDSAAGSVGTAESARPITGESVDIPAADTPSE